MVRNLYFLCLLLPFAQSVRETRKITVEYLFPTLKEVFYVLKSDSSVREGVYRLLSKKKILVQGYYKNGEKDSLWTQYNPEGIIRSRGYYSKSKRVGIWEYFDNKGEAEQRIDFTANQVLLYQSSFTNYPFRIISKSDTMVTVLDTPPLYLGGSSIIREHIANTMMSPFHKSGEKISGTVYIELTIDSTGKTSNHKVLKGVGPGCDREALRIVRLLPDQWIPGLYHGKSVTVNYMIPILFEKHPIANNPSVLIKKSK